MVIVIGFIVKAWICMFAQFAIAVHNNRNTYIP